MTKASKRYAIAAALLALLAGQGVAALAAPSSAPADRAGSPMGKAEKFIAEPAFLLIFGAMSGGLVAMMETTTAEEDPASP